mmetsp:Transcript_8574/g.33722  ORF Transcript_8574/g.33722 Transcript_8574/m.33722 type:complete len:240 (-) Transcript_8574:2677-3396(-)
MPHRAQVAHGRVAQRRRRSPRGKRIRRQPLRPPGQGQPLRRTRPHRRPSTAPRVPRQRREAQARRRRTVAARRHRDGSQTAGFAKTAGSGSRGNRTLDRGRTDDDDDDRLVVAVSVRHGPAARGVEGGRGHGGGRGRVPGFPDDDDDADCGELGREPLRDRPRAPRRLRRFARLAHARVHDRTRARAVVRELGGGDVPHARRAQRSRERPRQDHAGIRAPVVDEGIRAGSRQGDAVGGV